MRSYNRFDTPLTRAAVARLTAPEVKPMAKRRTHCARCYSFLWVSESIENGLCVCCRERARARQSSPIVGEKSGGHPEYLKLLDEMRELHVRKAADYGRDSDPFANVRAGAEFGVPAWVGVMIRANDKVHRIKSFIANGSLKNESVEDSLKDLAAYALIALVLLREDESKKGAA